MAQPPGPDGPRARPWLTPALCALFAVALLAQELLLLLQIAAPDQPLATWRWRLPLPALAIAAALLLPWRARWVFLGLLGMGASLALLADAAYFGVFGSLTSLRAAVSLLQLWDVRDSVAALIQPSHALLGLLLGALGLTGALLPDPQVPRRRERRVALGLAALAVSMATLAWRTPIYEPTHHVGRDPWQLPRQHWGSQFSPVRFAVAFGPLNYHARDLVQWLREAGSRPARLDPAREAELRAWLEHKHALNATTSPLFGLARGRHVLMVQLESWQQLLVDRVIDGIEVTPHFNALARSALVWDRILDVTHHGRTSDAEFAVHTGLLPDVRKPAAFHHLGATALSLPRSLKALGYHTASFHGYDRAFWNRAYTHREWGFDEMFFEEAYADDEQVGLGASDPAVYRLVARKLAEWHPRPSFAFVISLSSHHPYVYAPPEYAGLFARFSPAQGYGLLAGYLRSARYADAALGDLLAEMVRRGLHERTVYVIYGDHDLGGLGATRPIPDLRPWDYGPAGDRVPLLIAVPGAEERIAALRETYRGSVGGLHDLFPTLLHLLGETPPLGLVGTHLFVPSEQRDPLPLPAEGSFAAQGFVHGPRGALPLAPGVTWNADASLAQTARRERELLEDLLDHRAQARLAGVREPNRTRLARGD